MPDPRWRHVDRKVALSALEFARDYRVPKRPVVIEGATSTWAAMDRWTFDFLRQMCRDALVPMLVPSQRGEPHRRARLGPFIEHLQARDDNAVQAQVVDCLFLRDFPELEGDFSLPSYLKSDWLAESQSQAERSWLWMYIGAAGTRSTLHLDVCDSSAWLAVIKGRKRFRMFTATQSGAEVAVGIDLFGDELHLPAVEGTLCEAEAGVGDIVFVPSGWWHQVLNLEDSIAITGNILDATSYDCLHSALRRKQRTLGDLRKMRVSRICRMMQSGDVSEDDREQMRFEASEVVSLDRKLMEDMRADLKQLENEIKALESAMVN